MNRLASRSRMILRSFSRFVSEGCGIDLYYYQLQPAQAILESVRLDQGLTFVLDFPILGGKDELLAHLEAYLMRMLNDKVRTIVVLNRRDEENLVAVMRLGDRLNSNVLTQFCWKMVGLNFAIDKCRSIFYSMEAITVGKPPIANLLLIVNEAQNVHPEQFDHLNAQLTSMRRLTRVICGTEFDNDCLMSREIERAIFDEKRDGIKRLFKVSEAEARKENKVLEYVMTNQEELFINGETDYKSIFFSE